MTKPSDQEAAAGEEATPAKKSDEEHALSKETLADLDAGTDEEVKGGKPGCYGQGTGTSVCT